MAAITSTITARVPVEIKKHGDKILESLGATPTQLVNAAYDYLIAEKKLPKAGTSEKVKPGKMRKLSKEQKKTLEESFNRMQLGPIVDGYDFKEALNAVRDERYAVTA